MRSSQALLALSALGALVCAPAHAQQPNATPAAPTAVVSAASPSGTADPQQTLGRMRAGLRSLVVAQERYYSQHGTYTTDARELGVLSTSTTDSMRVQVIFAGGRGWTGVATHRALRGRSCVIYVGLPEELPRLPATMGSHLTAAEEGTPTCDAP